MNHIVLPQSRCVAGASRGDVTPPVGIYHRMWGAATHDRSTGVHRPLSATVLYLENPDGCTSGRDVRVMIALDHCLLRSEEMEEFLDRVAGASRVARESLLVFFSHTHGAGLMSYGRQSLPGGELIGPYLDELSSRVAGLVRMASGSKRSADITYGTGHCNLAANRDYYDEDRKQYVCGYNPTGSTDDTVLVARVTDMRARPVATVVNYACHPTTLAWENTLISPDYVGAMREVVEQAISAPCLFIQGASGDVGPRDGFVGDPSVADRNGRQLGCAALSALEAIPTAGHEYEYTGPVISGATLGVWKYVPISAARAGDIRRWQSLDLEVPLAYRDDLPDREQLERDRQKWEHREADAKAAGDALRARDARAMVERMTRSLSRVGHLPPGDSFPYRVRLLRMGDAVWVGLNGEHYNHLQRELRRRRPDLTIMVGTLVNGSDVSYLLDEDSYGKGLYQEEVSILAKGCLETLIARISTELEKEI